ncbi:hypothetical protein VPH35_023608 [Triticum aestivum]
MVKEKTAALEQAKKTTARSKGKATTRSKGKATSRGGSSSQTGLPKGWIQGDWIHSRISQEDLDDLAEGGMIPYDSARLPGKESEPQPREGERVLLATHVLLEEKAHVKVLVNRVVQLIRDGVTGMDLLKVFLQRRIQPLQARDHPMWMYSGLEDSTWIHPEEVDDNTLEKWLSSITGNKDNPRGARRVPPFDQSRAPEQAIIEMYTMPNGEQEQALEGEASGGESGEWTSDGEGDGGSDDSSDGEEVESPPRIERRSKLDQERPSARDKATAQAGQSLKRPRVSSPTLTEKAPKQPKVAEPKTRKALPKIKIDIPVASAAATSGTSAYRDDDEVMEDAVTSNPEPLSSALPSSSTAQAPVDPPSVFVTHHVPEDEVNAAREAIRQAGIMMEKMKMVRDASQAAYDASSALQSNIQKSCDLGARFADLEKQQIQLNLDLELARTELQKVRDGAAEALAKKDQDLAAARKEADDKTALAEQKLASVGQLEEENTRLKTALNEANRECTRWKKDNLNLNKKMEGIARRRDDLESYLRSLAKKLYNKLEEFCQNFEEETGRIEPGLDPINSPVKDETAMDLLRLESRIDGAMDYLARLK